MKELKITNEDIKLLKEMKDNCLKLSVYEDEKRLLKANAITKFLIEHEKKQELIDYLKEQIHYIKTNFSQVNGNYFMLNDKLETYEDILSKLVESDQIEKE